MDPFYLLAQHLMTIPSKELGTWLEAWVQPGSPGRSMMYGHDSSPTLVMKRVYPQLDQATIEWLFEHSLDLIGRYFEKPHADTEYASDLFNIAALLNNAQAVHELAGRVNTYYKLQPRVGQAILSILVDSPVKQSAEFWLQVQNLDPFHYSGFAISALMRIDMDAAVTLIWQVTRNPNTAKLVSMILGLHYSGLSATKQQDLLNKVEAELAKSDMPWYKPIRTWFEQTSKQNAT